MEADSLDSPPPVVHSSNWGLHNPASQRLFALMLFSTLGSLAVLLTTHPPRFRRVHHTATSKRMPHNPTVVVTDFIAGISLLNGLLAFFAPVEIMTVQVPHGVYAIAEPVDVPSTSLGFAVVFSLLTGGALTASSWHIWSCYSLGCRIMEGAPAARWKRWAFMLFEFVFVVLWLESHVHTQLRLRIDTFHGVFAAHRTRFIATVTLGIACGLAQITLNLAMLLVFARGINTLAEQTQILDAQRVGDLQRLAAKSMLYVSGNITLFIFLWFCFVVYPLNLRLAETTAIYHLALLLLLHLCFNVRGGLALRRTPPPNAGAAAAGGINEPLPAAHDELWATVQLQQRRQQRQEQEEKREAEGVEMKVVAGLPPDSPSGRGRRGRGGLFQRHAAAVTAAAGGGGGVSGDGGNCTPSGGRSPHSGGVDAEEGADGAFVSKAPWTPPRTRGEIPLPSPLEAGHSPRPKEKKGDGGIDGRGRRRQRRRPWAMWELPEVTHVFPNPWDYSRGIVFRISERVRSLSAARGERGGATSVGATAAAATATAAAASASSMGSGSVAAASRVAAAAGAGEGAAGERAVSAASSAGSGGGSASVALHPYQQQHGLHLQLEGVEEEGEGLGSSVPPTPVSRPATEGGEAEAGAESSLSP